MESNGELCCSDLPHEVIERVLSYLPLPDLCRFRCVCKGWNKLTRMPEFLDLCDLYKTSLKHEGYLFVTRSVVHDNQKLSIRSLLQNRPLGILDLDRHHWYTIPTHIFSREEPLGSRSLVMANGLTCELSGSQYNPRLLTVSDRVAATGKELPLIPKIREPAEAHRDLMVASAVDPVSRTYRVVVLSHFYSAEAYDRTLVYESSTNAWRDIGRPRDVMIESAVFLHDVMYVISYEWVGLHAGNCFRILILNPEEDEWYIIPVSIPRHELFLYPRLVVSGDCLCMFQWTPTVGSPPCGTSTRAEELKFWQSNPVLEISEIVVDSESVVVLAQLTREQLEEWFDEENVQIACAIPMFEDDSSGNCQSVVLMSRWSGKIVRHHLVSGVVEDLPVHPFGPPAASSSLHHDRIPVSYSTYVGNLTNLSLRSLTL